MFNCCISAPILRKVCMVNVRIKIFKGPNLPNCSPLSSSASWIKKAPPHSLLWIQCEAAIVTVKALFIGSVKPQQQQQHVGSEELFNLDLLAALCCMLQSLCVCTARCSTVRVFDTSGPSVEEVMLLPEQKM